jgi:hypothetical protein
MGETTYNKNNKGEKISGFGASIRFEFPRKGSPLPTQTYTQSINYPVNSILKEYKKSIVSRDQEIVIRILSLSITKN